MNSKKGRTSHRYQRLPCFSKFQLLGNSKQNVNEQIVQLTQEKACIWRASPEGNLKKSGNIERINTLKVEIEGTNEKSANKRRKRQAKELKAEGLSEEIKVLEDELAGMFSTR